MNIFESQGRSGKSHRKGLAAAGGTTSTLFHGADGADALQLQGLGQQW
jgi:hypothetical protein